MSLRRGEDSEYNRGQQRGQRGVEYRMGKAQKSEKALINIKHYLSPLSCPYPGVRACPQCPTREHFLMRKV